MMSVSPSASKRPAITSESPNASVPIATGDLKSFSSQEIFFASTSPITVPPSHTPIAFSAVLPICPHGMPPCSAPPEAAPAVCAPMMPMPIASTMMPSTSSITAPAIIVTPSSESILRRSDRMRAVMPTDVAVDMIPMNSAAGSSTAFITSPAWTYPCSFARHSIPPRMSGITLTAYTAHRSPNRNESTTPPIPTSDPANANFRNIFRFVSMPERNSSTTDAIVQTP